MKILIIHTGGTISCKYENGILTPNTDTEAFLNKILEKNKGISFKHKNLCSVLSECTDGKILSKITTCVKKAVDSEKYDGIIVTLGSDALAYTSAAISYSVGLSKTPVITVCSDLPLFDKRASGIANIRGAISVIKSKSATGTLTVYKKDSETVNVYRASRIISQPPYVCEPVPVGEIYGFCDASGFRKNQNYTEFPDAYSFENPHFSVLSPTMFITVYPGMIYPQIPKNVKNLILGTYHSGTLNTESKETLRFANYCKKRGIEVYISGISNGADYESMTVYNELGFKRLPELTSPAAMLIKLWIIGPESTDTNRLLSLSVGGDIIPQN